MKMWLIVVSVLPLLATEVSAQDISNDANDGVEEVIIVLGHRVSQTEFETATSVSVFTEDDLADYPAVQNTEDLLLRIPNITSSGTDQQQFAIRGSVSTGALVGGNAFSAGVKPRVTTTVDGYPITFNEFTYGATSIYDIDHVEVFRGPQTTTQGTNAIAGAIFVFTKDPTFEFSTGGLLEYGSNESVQAAGFVSGPISEDELAFRLSVDFRKSDSFVDFSGVSEMPGRDIDGFESHMVRGKLLWTPSAMPGFEAKLTVSDSHGYQPESEGVVITDPGSLVNARTGGGQRGSGSTVGILDANYEVSPNLAFTSQTSYSDFKLRIFTANFPRLPDFMFAFSDGTKLAQELYATYSTDDGRLSGISGVFYTNTDQTDTSFIRGVFSTDDKQQSLGLYSQLTYDLTDRLSVTGGLRYQYDEQARNGTFVGVDIDFDESFDAVLPRFEVAYDVTDDFRVGIDVSRGFNPGGVFVNVFAGVFDVFKEETVWTYDAFTRVHLLDGRLNLTGNVFYSDFSDYHKFTIVGFDDITGNPIQQVDNLDEAEAYGLELSADYRVTPSLSLFRSLGLLETSFEELAASAQIVEREFARSPDLTLFAGVSWEPVENLTLSAQARHSSKYFSEDNNIAINEVPSYWVGDASLRYNAGNFKIYGYVENFTDDTYPVLFRATSRFPHVSIGEPRTFGMGIEIEF